MGIIKSVFKAVGSLLGGGESPPAVQAPTPPPALQAAKAPAAAVFKRKNAAMAGPGGPLSGNAGTLLTGPSGVDPTSTSLGKSTLLGQ